MLASMIHRVAYFSPAEFSGLPKQPRNLETGMGITGAWIGMFYTKATDGRTR